jgi:hypothetical protein
MLAQISGYSYPRVAVIRIDVHPAGETRLTQHVHFPHQSMYARHTLLAGGPRMWQPFMSHQQSWTESLLPRKRASDTIHRTPADRSVGS